jgi:hypothetical protein
MKGVIFSVVVACALSACGSSDPAPNASSPSLPRSSENIMAGTPAVSPSASSINALPFSTEMATRNGAFQGNLKLITVEVGVDGGSTKQWTATAVAIAERIGAAGVDSVEVSVLRNDIHEQRGTRFREVAHVYFSPDPKRSVWGDGEKWKILQADPTMLSTQRDVDISDAYYALDAQNTAKGMSSDASDKKAGAIIAKRYHLPPNWRLPSGNDMNPELKRETLMIDDASVAADIAKLDDCLKDDPEKIFVKCSINTQ